MSSPLRILHLVWNLEPGGMENGLINMTRLFDRKDFEVYVCCLESGGKFVERFPYPENIRIVSDGRHFMQSKRRLGKLLHRGRLLWGLRKVLHETRPHLLHPHNFGPLIYAAESTWRGREYPILHGEHGQLTGEYCEPDRVSQRKKYWQYCRRVHTVSPSLKDHFVSFGFPEEKIEVVNNGVDSDHFVPPVDRAALRQRLNIPPNALVVGMVGRFGPWKRHDAVVEAFQTLAPKHPDLHLLFLGGEGTEEKRVMAQIERSVARERIHLPGFQQDTRPYYQAMDLLVIASINEGLPNALLEAMSSGVPALGHDAACGLREVMAPGTEGFVEDLSSPDKIVQSLERFIARRQDLPTMGQAARRKVTEQYSLRSMVAHYSDLYRRVARSY